MRMLLDDLLKNPSGANVSYDGALAFMMAEYVSSGELRCRIPPQAMTLRPWNVFSFMQILRVFFGMCDIKMLPFCLPLNME